jgi:hypothetical protein
MVEVSRLIDKDMLVEIEADAYLPEQLKPQRTQRTQRKATKKNSRRGVRR